MLILIDYFGERTVVPLAKGYSMMQITKIEGEKVNIGCST